MTFRVLRYSGLLYLMGRFRGRIVSQRYIQHFVYKTLYVASFIFFVEQKTTDPVIVNLQIYPCSECNDFKDIEGIHYIGFKIVVA